MTEITPVRIIREPQALKHVIVLDSANSSVPFLMAQGLKHPDALNDKLIDTEHLSQHPELLQSTDGIQFYHFTQKYPAINAGHFTGFEHLDRHLEIIEQQIAKKNSSIRRINSRRTDLEEKLDAVVIPDGILEKKSTLQWLDRLRARWPEVKVLVTNPPIHAVTDPLREDVYVQALNDCPPPMFTDPNYRCSDRDPYIPVGKNAINFRIAPQIDYATPNLRSERDNGDLLRVMIGKAVATGVAAPGRDAAKPDGKGRG